MDPERIGQYRLEGRLGAGGMGVVYRAYDERLDRWVAVKLVETRQAADPVLRERLRREARASARLSHPAVVRIYDLLDTGGIDAIVMELVEGSRLSDLLRRGPLDLLPGLTLALDVAGALAAAHAHGIVHRDLKAENVIVTPEGRAKVLDFGIAKQLGRGEDSLTVPGLVLGTCRAMAPEQAEGGEVDFRADLFSFGTLLYEMFTGQSPFLGPTPAATLRRLCVHVQRPAHQLAPHLPHDLSALIDRLLEKEPGCRPRDAREVVLALERTAATAGASLTPPGGSRAAAEEVTQSVGLVEPRISEEWRAWSRSEAASGWTGPAERRLVTAMSCGLIPEGGWPLDPEDLLEDVPALQALLAEVVKRFEGHLEPMRGHGWLAFFGYPLAHEDDARRAVRAALEIAARAGTLAAPDRRGRPALRIGIHTGPMVVGRSVTGLGDGLALGEAPQTASLVQSLAGPGAVLVSPATHRLIAEFFDSEELAPVSFPGVRQPLQPRRILADRDTQARLEAAGAFTPLVGREQELGLLLDRWALAREGAGQVVLLAGEAGLGKSRLIWELRRRVTAGSSGWLEAHGSPYHRHSALHPVIELLHRWLGTGGEEPPRDRLVRLEKALAGFGLPLPETLPLLASLLSLPAGEPTLPAMSPEELRRRTLDALLSLLLAAAERQPLLLAVEDLHWLDPTSLELLGRWIEHAPAAPLFLLLTFRPEFQPPWGWRSDRTRLSLNPLSREHAGLMVERMTAGRPLAPAVREQIAARTDGVPLFVEELTKMILEAGPEAGGDLTGSRPALEIPATLEGWLWARLDRLGTAREVAQLAAVLGREFPAELLRAVSPWSAEVLERELDRLVAAEILFRRGRPPRQRYLFKHALLQDAAYASLLRTDRQQFHSRAAEALVAEFPEVAETQPELLAHHFTGAGLAAEAIVHWRRAGQRAIRSWANAEAIGHFTQALSLLATLPETAERHQQEISLWVDLGVARGHTEGYSSPGVRAAYEQAWELCARAGPTRQLFPVLRGLCVFFSLAAQPQRGFESALQMLELAEREPVPALQLTAHQSAGFSLMLLGELQQARFHLEKARDLHDSERTGFEIMLPGAGDPPTEALSNLGWVLWFLGHPDEGLRYACEACRLADQLSFPITLFYTYMFKGRLHLMRRELEETHQTGERLTALAAETGLPLALEAGLLFQGWAMALQGRVDEGIARMADGIVSQLASGIPVNLPASLTFLADGCLRTGRFEQGFAAISKACSLGASEFHAEILRLRGELLSRLGDSEAAERDLLEALGVARRQGARSLELRAALGLGRLWSAQGRPAEARELLSGVYAGFTEGFDTGDLREARELLEEWAR